MKIYYVSQNQNSDYDTYSDFVCIAPDEKTARNMNPSNGQQMTESGWQSRYSAWCNSPDVVTVECIGTTNKKQTVGVVCASFHAG